MEWYVFTEVMHIAVKAEDKEQAMEQLKDLMDEFAVEFEYNPKACEVNDETV